MALKDNIDSLDGSPTTAGSPALQGNYSKVDSQVHLRLCTLGAINVGKTNMNEFALGTTTYNQHYGTAKHFLDETRIVGGSSGGSGGLVGSGVVPLSIGTDHSGSMRIPAAYCGIVGYKPTVNRWPGEFGIKNSHFKDVCGPMVNGMEDLVMVDE